MDFDLGYAIGAVPPLLRGAVVTIELAVLAVILGVIVAVLLTLIRHSRVQLVNNFAKTYISFARGTPLFIQILIIYYALPAIGFDVPRFTASVIALSLNGGAYMSEMMRGGLSAVPRGQLDAARAFGLSSALVWRHIKLPQAFVFILPPLCVEFMALVKASSLVSIIGVTELTRTAIGVISDTYRPLEIYLTAGIFYFVVCYAIGAVVRRFERLASLWLSV